MAWSKELHLAVQESSFVKESKEIDNSSPEAKMLLNKISEEAKQKSKEQTKEQAKMALHRLVSKYRGIVRTNSTKKPKGAPGSHSAQEVAIRNARSNPINNPINNPKWNPINNPINNPKWNPINNQAAQARAEEQRVNDLARYRMQHPDRVQVPTEALASPYAFERYVVTELCPGAVLNMLGPDVFGCPKLLVQQAVQELPQGWSDQLCSAMRGCILKDGRIVYVGQTGRELDQEALRWVTERGANDGGAGARNRPVLSWKNGNRITMKQARELLGARAVKVFEHPQKMVACKVEEELQHLLDAKLKLPLGIRLHRHVAMGAKADDPATPFFYVFCTVFSNVKVTRYNCTGQPDTMTINNHPVRVEH